jgi:hypothetical protein
MERSKTVPALVLPGDLPSGQDVLVVAAETASGKGRPSPFAAVRWRLVADGRPPAAPPRRPHGVA